MGGRLIAGIALLLAGGVAGTAQSLPAPPGASAQVDVPVIDRIEPPTPD